MTAALNPKFTLETFVVGSANRLAVTAGRTVAESPGSAYNPLFIYSASGLGKTHLLMAMGHAARRLAPGLNVEYLTLDEFVEAFHAAVAAGQGDAVRQRVQSVDMLLVDDVQFLTNRKEMQAELLRLTEALLSAGHQIVLASDRPPNEIADLDERLISRFSGGLVVDMGPPDYETRVAILRRKAEERGVSFAPGVLDAAAALELSNVRELMGALNRLVAYQAVSDATITPETAREARDEALVQVGDLVRRPVAGEHDLVAGRQQGLREAQQLRLHLLAVREELDVVHQQHVHRLHPLTHRIALPRRDGRVERLDEFVEREVLDVETGREALGGVAHRHQEVRLAQPRRAVDE